MELANEFVYERPVPKTFAQEVDHMRQRLERELAREAEGNVDIKLGHGGIADIDFIVQYLQILHGGRNPEIRRPDIGGALKALREAGHLLEEDEAALSEAYRFLRLVENRLRIATAQPIQTFPKSPEGLEMLARRIGYIDDEEGSSRAKLLAEYERQTQGARNIYRRIFSGTGSRKRKAKSASR
jgi:glutamate-ammonia-ligase adenylyltransferase